MNTTRYDRVTSHDNDEFDAYVAVPEAPEAPGIVLLQELFGINDNMRGIADQLAADGYLVIVPDMFWRRQRRFETKDESGIIEGKTLAEQADLGLATQDIASTYRHLLSLPECSGRIGGLGFCFGGTLAYLLATQVSVDGNEPAAVVSYYGHIFDPANTSALVSCPTLFHFGDQDPYIPLEHAHAVRDAFADRDDVEVAIYRAGHAFSNWDAPSFYQKEPADEAWARTTAFLAEHLKK
ncbi:dienelactone hydrolase family protein [Nocardia salmonicida]|uniref:dienelactone hydrolase family protein n=1 Tax=Nocardia salmonicida TaxID=53431 RepID=UPI00366B893F